MANQLKEMIKKKMEKVNYEAGRIEENLEKDVRASERIHYLLESIGMDLVLAEGLAEADRTEIRSYLKEEMMKLHGNLDRKKEMVENELKRKGLTNRDIKKIKFEVLRK